MDSVVVNFILQLCRCVTIYKISNNNNNKNNNSLPYLKITGVSYKDMTDFVSIFIIIIIIFDGMGVGVERTHIKKKQDIRHLCI